MYRIERADAKQETELAELGRRLAGEMHRLTPPLTRAPLEQMERAMEECRESGAAFLSLNVLAGNEGAEHLYRTMGFQDFRRSMWRPL